MAPIPRLPSFRRVPVALAYLLVLSLAACGSGKFFVPVCQETNSCSGGGGTTAASLAFVAAATTGSLVTFPLPKTFTSVQGTVTNLGTPPSAVAGSPKGNLLYVATASGSVFVYGVSANGALTLGNSGNPVTSTLLPTYMTIDPSGNWLFLISSTSPQLLVFQINTVTGALQQTSQGTMPLSGGAPTQVYVTPNDQAVYVGLGLGGMDTFAFNPSTGLLSNQLHLVPLLNGASADNAIAADNKSAYLFVGEAGSGIRVLAIGANGSLKEISGSPFPTQLGPASIVVDPTNTYVYVANSGANVITGYTLGSGGTLTPLSNPSFATGTRPVQMSLDSTGAYLLVINQGGNPDLQVFSFDTTTPGKLDAVTSSATGADPAGAVSLSVLP
jgi:6-phosphogluconolactonase (cycloisomerase 2 family)